MRIWKRTLRGRLVYQLVGVVLLSLAAFAEVAKNVIAIAQRDFVNAHLQTSAAALAFALVHAPGGSSMAALHALTEPDYADAIVARDGQVIATTAPVPDVVKNSLHFATTASEARKVGTGDAQYRIGAAALETMPGDRIAVFWHRVDFASSDADERTGMMLYAAIPLIILIAFFIGDRLTRNALAPLTRLARIATTIEASDLSRRIDPIPADLELADLCSTLNRMFSRLESAFDRQRRFTADVSHEFRAPLSVITAESDLAAAGLETLAEYRDSAIVILREAKLIESITNDLLSIARCEAGILADVEPVDVTTAAMSAVAMLAKAAEARCVKVICETQPGTWIVGNRTSVTRVFVALIDNAIKFTAVGSSVRIEIQRMPRCVRAAICDEGAGFSPAALEHAFEPFWRGDAVHGRDGCGLGLAIVRSLIDQAHGTISIKNRLPLGCNVTLSFPTSFSEAVGDVTEEVYTQSSLYLARGEDVLGVRSDSCRP